MFWSREGCVWSTDGEGRGELWRGDLRSVEMGVVEDVVERGVRMAYNKYQLSLLSGVSFWAGWN